MPFPDQSLPNDVIPQRPEQGGNQLVVVSLLEEPRRTTENFGQRARTGRNHRNARRHRLQWRKPEAFVDRRVDQDRCSRQER